jgi:crossover junction endodeoxyribonuclease RuvC
MTSLRLGYVFGVILCTLESIRIPVFKYPTKLVKRIIAKKGSSDKDQVELAVVRMLKLRSIDNQDSSDALAVAIAHVFEMQAPVKKAPARKTSQAKKINSTRKIVGKLLKKKTSSA